jgi:hypothetical protein
MHLSKNAKKKANAYKGLTPKAWPTASTGKRKEWHRSQFTPRMEEAKAKIRAVCPVNLDGKKYMNST